jgi:drug/metabolite transporter (DMT)-like permease
LAGLIGIILASGSIGQQIGLTTTSVTNAGFITSVYIAFVPFVAWAVLRTRLRPIVLVAVAISLAGAWLLANHGQSASLAPGDWIVLAASLCFSGHIISVSIFQRRVHRPYLLAFAQNAVTAAIALVLLGLFEPVSAASLRAAFPAMAYAGLVSGGIGYTLQILAQRHTPATEAALIMSMESVFAALGGALLLGERLTVLGAIGCALILVGVILVEVVPALSRRDPAALEEVVLGEVPLD